MLIRLIKTYLLAFIHSFLPWCHTYSIWQHVGNSRRNRLHYKLLNGQRTDYHSKTVGKAVITKSGNMSHTRLFQSTKLRDYWCLLTLLRQTQVGQWHLFTVGTPAQSFLISRSRRNKCGFVFHIQRVASFPSLSVSEGNVEYELKKLPCKFWLSQKKVNPTVNASSHQRILWRASIFVNNDNTIISIYKAIKLVPHHYWNLCMPNKQMAKSSHNLKYNAGLSNERTLSLLPVWFGVSTNTQLLIVAITFLLLHWRQQKKK